MTNSSFRQLFASKFSTICAENYDGKQENLRSTKLVENSVLRLQRDRAWYTFNFMELPDVNMWHCCESVAVWNIKNRQKPKREQRKADHVQQVIVDHQRQKVWKHIPGGRVARAHILPETLTSLASFGTISREWPERVLCGRVELQLRPVCISFL